MSCQVIAEFGTALPISKLFVHQKDTFLLFVWIENENFISQKGECKLKSLKKEYLLIKVFRKSHKKITTKSPMNYII